MNSLISNAIYMDDVPKSQWKDYGIGRGYRSICYTTDSDRSGKIVLFGFDINGKPTTYIFPWQSYIKYNCKFKTDEQDIYGNYVTTKYFKNSFDRSKYIKNANGLNIVECFKPEQEFAHFMWDENILEADFNKQPLRIHYFDIETEISDQFMKPSQADNRINMMTIYDSMTEKFYTWSLEHAEIDFKEAPLKDYPKDKFVFFEFHNNEVEMLEHFLAWYEDNYPDVNYGWNTKAYDIPYLTRRIENVLGKNAAKILSPIGRYFIKEVNHDNKRADVAAEIEVNIDGLFIADGLVLYRDKFMVSHPDGGYTLDNIGEVEGCGQKIHYEGTLKDLYLKDYQKFYEYNVRDVDLCKRIDDKCKMIQLARQITSFGLTGYGAIYSSISYLIGSVSAFAKTQMGGKIFNSYLAEKHQFDGFEGAYVFPTEAGIYRGGIGCIDFASLYPSNIRAINASPETFIGKILIYFRDEVGNITCNTKDEAWFNPFSTDNSVWGVNDEGSRVRVEVNAGDPDIVKLELKLPSGKRKEIDLETLKKLIETKCIWTANNTLFLKHEIRFGVIPKWCEVFYGLRKSTKKKMLACFHKLHNPDIVMTEAEKLQTETDEENYNTTQLGIKSMINSIYGCMGTSFSPIANPDIAQTITRQGRFCNINTSKFIRRQFEKYFNIDSSYVTAISGDTDSQFINLQCISDYLKKKRNLPKNIRDWTIKDKKLFWKLVSQFVDKEVNPYVRQLVHDYCKTTQQNVLTYELEYMSDVGVYESMKHYATHKIFDEGDLVDKIKYAGIELKKAQVPKEMKTFLAEIYDGVINKDWEESDYKKYIEELYSNFRNYNIDQVSFWKGYNTERQAVGFLEMQVGTTGIAKACTYYNQIIEKLGLKKQYDEIRVGDKVRLCYIEPGNEYGIDQIAYKPGQWPKEFDEIFKVDYKKMFFKIILDPLKAFRNACKFENIDPSKQVAFDVFDL